MIKKIVFAICMIFVVILSLISIVQMYETSSSYELNINSDNIEEMEVDLSDTVVVECRDLSIQKKVDVEVVAVDDELIEEYELAKNDTCYINKGQVIEKNGKLFKLSGKEYIADSAKKCLSIEEKNDNKIVRLLNYSKLRIKVKYPVEQVNYELYDKVSEFDIGTNKVTGVVDYIDYVSIDGYVDVYFSITENVTGLICGMKGSYIHTLETVNEALVLPRAFIVYDENKDIYYVEEVKNGVVMVSEVEVGLIGEMYAQILSGVNQGDVVRYPSFTKTLFDYSVPQ